VREQRREREGWRGWNGMPCNGCGRRWLGWVGLGWVWWKKGKERKDQEPERGKRKGRKKEGGLSTHVHSSLIRLNSNGHLVREGCKVLVRELGLTSKGLAALSGLNRGEMWEGTGGQLRRVRKKEGRSVGT